MSIEDRLKNIKPLNKKEEYLTNIIDILDKETLELFKEIMDLSDSSIYKLNPLYERTIGLTKMYSETTESLNKLLKAEANNYSTISGKYQFRYLLITITTFYAFMTNALLGIVAFILLTKRNNKDFAKDVVEIYDSVDMLYDSRVSIIQSTLDNCTRILNGKKEKILQHYFDNNIDLSDKLRIMISNDAVMGYLSGETSVDQIMHFSDENKSSIVEMLKKDLNVDTDNLEELLNLTKEKNDHGMKLVMEYKND